MPRTPKSFATYLLFALLPLLLGACVEQRSGTVGSLAVTVDGLPDGTPAGVTLDGPGDDSHDVDASTTLDDLPVGRYTVRAPTVEVDGTRYRTDADGSEVRVEAGTTARLELRYAALGDGGGATLIVTVDGLPQNAAPRLRVEGPGGYARDLTDDTRLEGLEPGVYRLRADEVTREGRTFRSDPAERTVPLAAGETREERVTYADAGPAEVIVAAETRVVDDTTREALTGFDGGTLTFDGGSPLLQDLEPGAVLVSEPVGDVAPDGFLRRVTAIDRSGGRVMLTTEPATLTDVFERASIGATVASAPSTPVEPLLEGVTVAPAGLAAQQLGYSHTFTFDRALFEEIDPKNGATTRLRLHGAVTLGVEVDFDLDIDLFEVESFRTVVTLREDLETNLTLEGRASVSEEIAIARIPLAQQVVPVGPVPVVFTQDVVIYLGGRAETGLSATARVTQSLEVQAGAAYRAGDGWSPVSSYAFSFDGPENLFDDPLRTLDAEIFFKLRGYLKGQTSVRLYGVPGVGIAVSPYLESVFRLRADPPWWQLFGGIEVDLVFDAEVPIISQKLVAFVLELAEFRKELARAGDADPVIREFRRDGSGDLTEGGVARFTVDAFDLEGTDLGYAWFVDNRSAAGSGSSFDARDLCPGTRRVHVEVSDAGGNRVRSEPILFTVLNAPPTVSLVDAPTGPVAAADIFALRAEVADPTCDGETRGEWSWQLEGGSATDPGDPLSFGSFAANGSYGEERELRVTYTDRGGLTANAVREVTVAAPDPDGPSGGVLITDPRQGMVRKTVQQLNDGDLESCVVTLDYAARVSDAALTPLTWEFLDFAPAPLHAPMMGTDGRVEITFDLFGGDKNARLRVTAGQGSDAVSDEIDVTFVGCVFQ